MNSVLDPKKIVERYPRSENKSLRAWNSADEYILNYLSETKIDITNTVIYNDRFGYLNTFLFNFCPSQIIDTKSQEKSIIENCKLNNLDYKSVKYYSPLSEIGEIVNLGIIKIPKSMELFRLYLNQISNAISEDALVICGFMTKYFTTQMLDIANEFFENVEQSLAWKKSRLLLLSKPKHKICKSIINEIDIDDDIKFKQYFGVFSSKNIDYATQFLIENVIIKETDSRILDLASGNGIISFEINRRKKNCEIHLVDDSYLAIESSKLNLDGDNYHFHFSDSLEIFDENFFDFVISNPPSHFEFETNIEISIKLFSEVHRVLKDSGHFQLVANRHLNYKTHLIKIFRDIKIISENKKFIIYDCLK